MSRAIPLCFPAVLLAACAEPDPSELFHTLEVFIEPDEAGTTARFVEVIDGARDTLAVALPEGEATDLTDAIGRAWDRGVAVEVVTDIDRRDDAGFITLLDAGVPTSFADDSITYFDFSTNRDVAWTSDQAVMSEAFAVADGLEIVSATRAGSIATGWSVVVRAHGEELAEDFLSEHNQLFGGADAVSLTAFSSLAKSIADFRWRYSTQSSIDTELWFGPQERLTKRMIDAVYGARGPIRVLTDDFANDGFAKALQDKAAMGFDAEVIVGPHFLSSSSVLSRVLRDDTPDVRKLQVNSLERLPTVLLVDYGRADRKGRAFVLTHDLYSASRLFRGQEVVSDQYIDGTLWVINDYDEDPSPELLVLEELYNNHLDLAEAL